MRLCLTCRYLSGADAAFCGHCARSFGGRRCARGHTSPSDAAFCVRCGRAELSEATASLNLGFLPAVLSLLVAFGLLCLLGRYGGVLIAWAGAALEGGFTLAAGRPSGAVVRPLLERMFAWAIVLTVLLHLIPGRFGRDVRRSAGRMVAGAWRLLARGTQRLFCLRQAERVVRLLRPQRRQ